MVCVRLPGKFWAYEMNSLVFWESTVPFENKFERAYEKQIIEVSPVWISIVFKFRLNAFRWQERSIYVWDWGVPLKISDFTRRRKWKAVQERRVRITVANSFIQGCAASSSEVEVVKKKRASDELLVQKLWEAGRPQRLLQDPQCWTSERGAQASAPSAVSIM